MDYRMLGVLCLVIMMTYTPQETKAAIPQETVEKITTGLEAGQALADVLKDGNFRRSLVSMGTKLAPFLSVLGPLAAVAFTFIPTGDSPELIEMKKQFREVNNKLDIVISEFQEVKDAIDWSAIKVSYGTYERKIRAAEVNLNRAYSLQGNAFEVEKNNFVRNFEQHFENSLEKLYDAIVNDDHVFSENILDAALQQTKSHKPKVEKFSLGLVQLLIEGINVKVSYYALSKKPYDHLIDEWEKKMRKLCGRLEEVIEEIKKVYHAQLSKDTNSLIDSHYTLDNKGLKDKIYDFVVDKFDWRYWFVAVYDDVVGYDKHTIYTCGGAAILHKKGKNIIISSQDKKYSSRFNKNDEKQILKDVESDIDGCSTATRDPGDRARALVRQMRKRTGGDCIPYALKMAAVRGKSLSFISWNSNCAYRKVVKGKRCRWDCSWWGCSSRHVSWSYNMIVFG